MRILAQVEETLAARGFDLCARFSVAAYNRAVDAAYALPQLGRSDALGLLIGNTRALWPHFVSWLREDPRRVERAHPLESYAEEAIGACVKSSGVGGEVRFSHEPPGRRFAAQHLAQLAGLAHLSESMLSVHARYGPWIALRAAWVVPVGAPPEQVAPPPQPCRCAQRCLPAFSRALRGGTNVASQWTDWVAVREACPVGRDHRYCAQQLRYHYTKDREVLREALQK